jgi:DNA-binding Lrp family transcriptional regulator
MRDSVIDDIDRAILYELQTDARHNTNAAISDRVGVSASTVGKRITRLEDCGIIDGYHPEIDYEEAGFPLHVLFICTVSITDRAELIDETLEIDGVLDIRELMRGRENVHIRAIGSENDDITKIAQTLDNLGYSVTDEILLREEYNQPAARFDADP